MFNNLSWFCILLNGQQKTENLSDEQMKKIRCKQHLLLRIKYLTKQIQFVDSSFNGMEDIDNLKIKNGNRPPCWISIFVCIAKKNVANEILKKTKQIR